jgi:DNA-binding XRE family transcriptional regulator
VTAFLSVSLDVISISAVRTYFPNSLIILPSFLIYSHRKIDSFVDRHLPPFYRVHRFVSRGAIYPSQQLEDSEGMWCNAARRRIRLIREQRNLSRRQLADRIPISADYLKDIERGESPGSVAVLEQLAAALEVDMYTLFLCG